MALMRTVVLLLLLATLAACGGDGSSTTTTPATPKTGADIYSQQCVLCHGRDGKLGINGAKDLTTSTLTREEMIVLVTTGKGLMSPYAHVLSVGEVELVVDHVRMMKDPS